MRVDGSEGLNGLGRKSYTGEMSRPLVFAFCFFVSAMRVNAATQLQSRLPISFEPSQGQARFVARGLGYSLFITDAEVVAVVKKAVVTIGFTGAHRPASITGEDPLPGHANYFVGGDPSKWRTDVPMFRRVVARGVYEGIDLVYYGKGNDFEYDFIVHPGADPRQIRLSFGGAEGVEQDPGGDIVLHVPYGMIRQHPPAVYQESRGQRTLLHARYHRTNSHTFALDIAGFDRTKTLVVDPTLAWSTYLGGSNGDDVPLGIAVDPAGNTYVAGATTSATFPTVAAYQPSLHGGYDAFVAKFDPAGSSLLYATYLGGLADDIALGIAVNGTGEVFVAGVTGSADFPTSAGAYQTSLQGTDGFVTRISSTGNSLVYSTFIGKSGRTQFNGLAVDTAGNAHVTGVTNSSDYPTTPGAFQTGNGGSDDAIVTVLNSTGTSLLFSTYLGGISGDDALGLALDASGNTYVTGNTTSSNFPTSTGAFQATLAGTYDAWVAKFDASNALVYSTYLGGTAVDSGQKVVADSVGNAYIAGYTYSSNFPVTAGVLRTTLGGPRDAFVSKLNTTGSALVYSTYLGGSNDDVAVGISIDASFNAYICGGTASSDFPVVNATQPTLNGVGDAYVAKLDATGTSLLFSTYLGGSSDEMAETIHVNAAGDDIRVAGFTDSSDFPTVRSLQTAVVSSTTSDGFITNLVFGQPDLTISKTHAGIFIQGTGPLTYTIRVTNVGNAPTSGTVSVIDTLPAGMTGTAMSGSGWTCNVSALTCTITTPIAAISSYPDITLTVNVSSSLSGTVSNVATVSGGGETNMSNDMATDPTTVLPNTAIPALDSRALAALGALLIAIAAMHVKR